MFEFIRTHQRLMQLILLILILPSFAFFGLQSYNGFKDGAGDVAKVAGQGISQQQFDQAQRNQAQRMQQQMGANFDAKQLDTPEAKAEVLNALVSERVTLNEIAHHHLYVSSAVVQNAIGEIPAVKALFGADGKLDAERYKLLLSTQNLTHEQLFADIQRNLLLKQVISPVQDTAVVAKAVANRLIAILGQQREVSEVVLKLADYQAQAKLAPDAVQKYYDGHSKEFELPEQVDLEYLVLNADALAGQISVTDAAIEDYYQQNQKRYSVAEQRRASHILIDVAKDAKPEEQQKAKAKAEEILAKLKANPADLVANFAKLAKENSKDPGSAANGGDLGYAGKGAYVPPFEKALFELKENQISELVQSEFGYHIIVLTGIKPAVIKPLETVKPEIEAEIRKQLVAKKFAESAESFSNTVYEQADSLKPAADKFDLKLQTANGVTRTPATNADAKLPVNNAKLLAAVFTDDVLKKNHNTAAIETAPNTMVAARTTRYKPAALRPLAEVSEAIKTKLLQQEAQRLAREAGEAKLAALQKEGDGKEAFSAPQMIGRGGAPNLSAEAVPSIFKADVTKLPSYSGLTLSSGDYAIYRISKLGVDSSINDTQRAQLVQQLQQQYGNLEAASYLESLKKNAKVKYLGAYANLMAKATAEKPAP